MANDNRINSEGKDADAEYEIAKQAEQNKIYQNNKLETLSEAQKQGQIAADKDRESEDQGLSKEQRNSALVQNQSESGVNSNERMDKAQMEENNKAAQGSSVSEDEQADARAEGQQGVAGAPAGDQASQDKQEAKEALRHENKQEEKGEGAQKVQGDHLKSDKKGSDEQVNKTLRNRE